MFAMADGFASRPLWSSSESNKSLEQNTASDVSRVTSDYRSGQDDGNEDKSISRQRSFGGNCNGSFIFWVGGTSPKVNKPSLRGPATFAVGELTWKIDILLETIIDWCSWTLG